MYDLCIPIVGMHPFKIQISLHQYKKSASVRLLINIYDESKLHIYNFCEDYLIQRDGLFSTKLLDISLQCDNAHCILDPTG